MRQDLAELNFKELLHYPEVTGYSAQKPYKCTGFCIDCEKKGLLMQGEVLERMSHGADSSDFRSVFPKEYSNNTRVMFVMFQPAYNHWKNRDTPVTYQNYTKDIPSELYYWISDYINNPVKWNDIMQRSVYDLYWWYLQEKHSLNNIYITNLLKCNSSLKKNDNKEVRENCYQQFFEKEVDLFKPEIIFAMHHKVSYLLTTGKDRISKKYKVVSLLCPALVDNYHRNKEIFLNENDKRIANALSEIQTKKAQSL